MSGGRATLCVDATMPNHPWPAGFDPFVLARDQQPAAWTDPRGTRIDWLD